MTLFLPLEKAYDMLWKEGFMIKLDIIGITRKKCNWIHDFLFDSIFVCTPQSRVISPFSVIINDIFSQVQYDSVNHCLQMTEPCEKTKKY